MTDYYSIMERIDIRRWVEERGIKEVWLWGYHGGVIDLHQIEAILRHVDSHLFWDKFVGKPGEGHCGWAHYPPNASSDYDWANRTSVWTDIEDWTPEGAGRRQQMNCTRWGCDSLQWFIYWMQNLPGADNGLSYRGRPLRNWWTFIGDFDEAMSAGRTVTQ